MPHRHAEYRPRCRDCEAVATRRCRRCGRPLCAGCEPPPERRCGRCEREWGEHEATLASEPGAPRPARYFTTHVLAPSALAAALAFVVLLVGGGGVFGPLLMALALIAAVNLPLLALGPRDLADEIAEVRTRARINAARHRFLAARPPGD